MKLALSLSMPIQLSKNHVFLLEEHGEIVEGLL